MPWVKKAKLPLEEYFSSIAKNKKKKMFKNSENGGLYLDEQIVGIYQLDKLDEYIYNQTTK